MLGVEIDVQLGQMTLRSKHLAALPSEIANHPDCKLIFGDATIQASLLDRAEHMQRYRLVGLNHQIEYWPTPHTVCPPVDDHWEREYDPADLFESESWIINLFEPIRKNFFDGLPGQPPPMQFLMPEKALSEEAEVAIILGLHQKIGGPFKLVYLFRRLKCLHVYECVTQGREWFYSLHLTTDTRFCLRELDRDDKKRRVQHPSWWVNAGGHPYPKDLQVCLVNDISDVSRNFATSALIIREDTHHLNLSGGKEKFVPARLLYGAIPQALLDTFRFWEGYFLCYNLFCSDGSF